MWNPANSNDQTGQVAARMETTLGSASISVSQQQAPKKFAPVVAPKPKFNPYKQMGEPAHSNTAGNNTGETPNLYTATLDTIWNGNKSRKVLFLSPTGWSLSLVCHLCLKVASSSFFQPGQTGPKLSTIYYIYRYLTLLTSNIFYVALSTFSTSLHAVMSHFCLNDVFFSTMNCAAFPQEWVNLSSNVMVLIVSSRTVSSRQNPNFKCLTIFTLKQLLSYC